VQSCTTQHMQGWIGQPPRIMHMSLLLLLISCTHASASTTKFDGITSPWLYCCLCCRSPLLPHHHTQWQRGLAGAVGLGAALSMAAAQQAEAAAELSQLAASDNRCAQQLGT
jgi:hypothetical protein